MQCGGAVSVNVNLLVHIPADQKQKQEVEPGIRHQVPPLSDPPFSSN